MKKWCLKSYYRLHNIMYVPQAAFHFICYHYCSMVNSKWLKIFYFMRLYLGKICLFYFSHAKKSKFKNCNKLTPNVLKNHKFLINSIRAIDWCVNFCNWNFGKIPRLFDWKEKIFSKIDTGSHLQNLILHITKGKINKTHIFFDFGSLKNGQAYYF